MKKLHNQVNKEELKEIMLASEEARTTLSFYKYAWIDDPESYRDHMFGQLDSIGVFGRIYVATEGINAQISIPANRMDEFTDTLYSLPFLDGIRLNIAVDDDGKSFYKLTIKVRHKILADGLDDDTFDVTNRGVHLDAGSFNELTDREDAVIIDMRNHYESEVGHFENAICPDVETFRESLPIIENMLEDKKDQPLVMYCTGGIRCEKASAYFKHRGFGQVYQLDGGIIEYTRQVSKLGLRNKFHGKNFVFDERLGERISDDVIARCHQCGKLADTHVNCANDACHILFIQCDDCAETYDHCCSKKCADFHHLPEEKQLEYRGTLEFNGTKFGKGRYKAHRKDEPLVLEELELLQPLREAVMLKREEEEEPSA